MIRILLACGIGASTGFMAASMRKSAKQQGLDIKVNAVSKSQVMEYADKIDVLLLGPHFSGEVSKYREMLKDHHVKVTSIDPEYYAELDVAVELSKKIAVDDYEEAEHIPFVIIGHSLGGLISSLYVNDRSEEHFTALVLNSPFLDMNFNWFVRKVGLPFVSELALFLPDFTLGPTGDPNYAHSILKREKGEWEYNENLKSVVRPTQYLGWLRAIMNAQGRVHSKLKFKHPVLVMHSGCSIKSEEWSDDYRHCDGVLNVEHMDEWSHSLGDSVTTKVIQDGLHDLYLSRKDVRDRAYRETFDFIDEHVK